MTQDKLLGSMVKSVGTTDPITVAHIITALQELSIVHSTNQSVESSSGGAVQVEPFSSGAVQQAGVEQDSPDMTKRVQTTEIPTSDTRPAFPAPAKMPALNSSPALPAPTPSAILTNPESWFAVIVGREVGVFRGWFRVQPLVHGVSGGGCKKYSSYAAAQHAFDEAKKLGLVQVRL
ncbi:hypothetical protein C0992_009433 [Termitomyces sp. T32_za158]|nr:hypothetical protein C0992_009433 [Termitomyces sp. T32_za158]